MSTKPKGTFVCDDRIAAAWEQCWEALLLLPTSDVPADRLHAEAAALVRETRSQQIGDVGTVWLEKETAKAHRFVTRKLRQSPDDEDWNRLLLMLDGAMAALRGAMR